MPNPEFFRPEFDALAEGGCIGDPKGRPAYAYMRVSDAIQAEEGRSGLPRQLHHIHEIASKKGLRITWDLLYADDSSGFDFEDRPALSLLRREYKSPQRIANALVIEHLDRLSRNADWHQGFLLNEMKDNLIEVVFWKAFSSRIERAVMGAISQEGMEQAKERMREGSIKKAKSGRITAKVPALGYKFVDSSGQENTMEARVHTHYAIDDERGPVMEFVFTAMAYEGLSAYEVIKTLDERAKDDSRFRPPRGKVWNERTLVKMIRNPVYKGEYIANRFYNERVVTYDEHGAPKKTWKIRQRPETEWVRVSVPAIVDEGTWELANKNLYRNKDFSRRNKKHEYLLTGLIRCDTCGWRYHGHTDSKKQHIQRYYCSKIYQTPALRQSQPCDQRSIHCEVLDAAVWEVVTALLLNEDVLLEAIDAKYSHEGVQAIREQIKFIEREIENKGTEETKLKQAYFAGAYTAEEFAGERQRIVKHRETLSLQHTALKGQILSPEELAERKQATITLVTRARESIDLFSVPFTLKRQIVRLLVDEVRLNTEEGWFGLTGAINTGLLQVTDDLVARTSSL